MKRVIAALLAAVFLGSVYLIHCWREKHWQAWEAFARVFVQADGRVIDRTAGDRSTSEAQAYALFFALVANDSQRFQSILSWTANNLAQADLHANLPAWLWGARGEDGWGVRDANPASDADLWLAYTLFEAARLWQQPEYALTAKAVLELVKAHEIADVPALGLMLLPAPHGFVGKEGGWRFNPSYLPEFQMRALQREDPQGPWLQLWQNHVKAMRQVMNKGIAPDWYEVTVDGQIVPDRLTPHLASYDAIRVPLWDGMTPRLTSSENDFSLRPLLLPFAALLAQTIAPAEKWDAATGQGFGGAPIGFSAAVLPFLSVMDEDAATRQRQRLKNSRVGGNLGSPPHYYDQALAMFGEGWDSRRFRFDQDGRLIPKWEKSCCD